MTPASTNDAQVLPKAKENSRQAPLQRSDSGRNEGAGSITGKLFACPGML